MNPMQNNVRIYKIWLLNILTPLCLIRIMASSCRIAEKFMLRLALLSVHTHLEEVELLLKVIRNKIKEITDSRQINTV